MSPFSALTPDIWDVALRLGAATLLGMSLGLERLLRGKPTGIRTLGLVSFGAALVTIASLRAPGVAGSVDALSRVLQGVDQGVLVGIGFLGGGIILRDLPRHEIHNVTTAAEVWVIAAIGLATAVAPWILIGLSYAILVVLMVVLRLLELRFGLKDHS